ncbi:DUF6241 domain-containing protein [Bacillus alveayuensis]|jgi:uncharacterized protein YneF (UPF0154 family)|uniref:DUF6241 domain-containing protein n=1 Tax=Aeribacillus alveayuensis TaxID=279215 RepID=UPI0005CCFE66|nr:DUF6241 domain-containing protein [Bacillus alveayuensis]
MLWLKQHKALAAIAVTVFICVSILTYIFLDMFMSENTKEFKSEKTPSSQEVNVQVEISENPFGDKGVDLSEKDIQNYIHGMSHQKVKADEKWIHYFITEERIQFLIDVVENGDYKHKDLYLDILSRWKDGDFSQADQDHNEIWRLQGGTVGKATGVLTKEEEEAYLEKYKKVLK